MPEKPTAPAHRPACPFNTVQAVRSPRNRMIVMPESTTLTTPFLPALGWTLYVYVFAI